MIKVAIVGTNGLAQYIANTIATTTPHQFVIISRNPSPGLTAKGWQVLQVDYNNQSDLRFKLAGVDTVISTISGPAQLALIDAAAAVRVRRFIPSEFEGSPTVRPSNDVLDNNRRAAILRLTQHEPSGMRFTVFTCGIFYERFAPGGMAAFQVGVRSPIGQEGEYLMDFRNMQARFPYYGSTGHPVYVCMTSVRDVARFVVAALDIPSWPREFRLRGERMSVSNLVAVAEQVRGRQFEIASFSIESLQDEITIARAVRDRARELRAQHLIVTANGRYDFNNINLNHLVAVQPERFRAWLLRIWQAAL